jgi:hypothetical protein
VQFGTHVELALEVGLHLQELEPEHLGVDRDRVIASSGGLRFVDELVGLDGLLAHDADRVLEDLAFSASHGGMLGGRHDASGREHAEQAAACRSLKVPHRGQLMPPLLPKRISRQPRDEEREAAANGSSDMIERTTAKKIEAPRRPHTVTGIHTCRDHQRCSADPALGFMDRLYANRDSHIGASAESRRSRRVVDALGSDRCAPCAYWHLKLEALNGGRDKLSPDELEFVGVTSTPHEVTGGLRLGAGLDPVAGRLGDAPSPHGRRRPQPGSARVPRRLLTAC